MENPISMSGKPANNPCSEIAVIDRIVEVTDATRQIRDLAISNLDSGGNSWANDQYYAAEAGFTGESNQSDMATAVNHELYSKEFERLAASIVESARLHCPEPDNQIMMANRVGNYVAQAAFDLSRHFSESGFAKEKLDTGDLVTVEGETFRAGVAPACLEDKGIDVVDNHKYTYQIFTGTSGKSPYSKIDNEDMVEHVDFYVVLNTEVDGKFGVGVQDLRDARYTDNGNDVVGYKDSEKDSAVVAARKAVEGMME